MRCHPRARGDPVRVAQFVSYSWIPACVGMTMYNKANLSSLKCVWSISLENTSKRLQFV